VEPHQNISENLYIGRYSKGQISANNIGGPIYRPVFSACVNNVYWYDFIDLEPNS